MGCVRGPVVSAWTSGQAGDGKKRPPTSGPRVDLEAGAAAVIASALRWKQLEREPRLNLLRGTNCAMDFLLFVYFSFFPTFIYFPLSLPPSSNLPFATGFTSPVLSTPREPLSGISPLLTQLLEQQSWFGEKQEGRSCWLLEGFSASTLVRSSRVSRPNPGRGDTPCSCHLT